MGAIVDEFPYLADHAERLSHLTRPLAGEQVIELLCSDCPFFRADSREESRCGSFQILRRLLESGRIEPDDIVTACTDT
jgi:hypothetical protein